jgi:hypothetical protein
MGSDEFNQWCGWNVSCEHQHEIHFNDYGLSCLPAGRCQQGGRMVYDCGEDTLMFWLIVAIYVLVQTPGQDDQVRSYNGQSQATIMRLLKEEGRKGTVISKAQYEDFIKKQNERVEKQRAAQRNNPNSPGETQ